MRFDNVDNFLLNLLILYSKVKASPFLFSFAPYEYEKNNKLKLKYFQ